MEQKRTKLTVINLVAVLLAAGAGLAVARMTGSLSAYAVLPFLGLGFLVTAVSYFQMRLAERARMEQLEYEELTKTPASGALFDKAGAESQPARRAQQQFEKFFVPAFTLLLLGGEATGAVLLWRWLARAPAGLAQQPMLGIVAFALFFLILFMLGRYSVALARLENQRLLQPVASFVLADAYFCAIVAITLGIVYFSTPSADLYVAYAFVLLLGVIGVETLLTLLLEIYRPRVRGKELRLLYDSRITGLLAQPESLFTAAAQALDYQFGFAVSQTRFFKFLQQGLAWIIAAQVLLVLASTMFVVIDTGEEALLERFGKPVQPQPILGPGFHAKWPWPIDKIHRYRTEQIQSFEVGLGGEEEKGNTVLWTVSHSKEEFNLLVASREVAVTNGDQAKKSPPVNLLSVGIPVQYQVTNLFSWAYNNIEPGQLLESIATREAVRHLASADLNEIMSSGRAAAAEVLRQRIQAAASARNLGVRVIFVGLQDIHPPVAVAGAYEKVVGAHQSRTAKVLAARAQGQQTNGIATATAYRTVREAEAERDRTRAIALARAGSFTNQIPALRAAPEVYRERAYLQALTRNGAAPRKYVLATSNTEDVILFNLQDKLRTDLLDVAAPAPPAPKR